MPYEFSHYKRLEKHLSRNTDEATKDKILENMNYIKQKSTPEEKAEWACEMMRRIDSELDEETRIKVREACACIISNEKSIYAQSIRRLRKQFPDDNEYLDEVVKYLNGTAPLRRCGEVSREGDKLISVFGTEHCECSAIREELKEPISVTWCHCCKGSLLSVYRFVFKDKVCKMSIVETRATGGKCCKFITEYIDSLT